MRNDSRRTWLAAVLAIAALAVVAWFVLTREQRPAAEARRDLERTELGTSQPEPRTSESDVDQRAEIARVLRLHVTTATQAPISGASVRDSSSSGAALLGTTDATGTVQVALAQLISGLRVSANGFRAKEVELPRPLPDELTVVLEALGCIAGRVQFAGGNPPSVATVIAFPTGAWPSAHDVASRSDLHKVETDLTGMFEFCDLPAGSRWTLLAGCQGYATPEAAENVAPDQPPVDLALAAYDFFAIEGALEGDSTPCVSSRLNDFNYGMQCAAPAKEMKNTTLYRALRRLLAGIPLEWCDLAFCDLRGVLLEPEDPSHAGTPIRCSLVMPGYELGHARFPWSPLREGFHAERFVLRQTADSWASLHLILEGIDLDGLAETESPLPTLCLLLHDQVSSKNMEYDVHGCTAEGITIDCIPAGTYTWAILAGGTTKLTATKGYDLELKDVTELRVELAQSCAVEVTLTDEAGAPYLDRAHIGLNIPQPGRSFNRVGTAMFDRAPYRVLGLPAGDYTITLELPAAPDGLAPYSSNVSLREGQHEQVAFIVRAH